MSENKYRDMMDKLQFSPDFEKQTLEKLARAKKRRRGTAFLRTGIALAACAAIALAVTPMLRDRLSAPVAPIAPAVVDSAPVMDAVQNAPRMKGVTQAFMTETADGMIATEYAFDMPQYNLEEYKYLRESGFRDVLTSPLSTFAADVDTASYANVRRMILRGQDVPQSAVRVEEMLNYFTYAYPEPTDKAPFSVTAKIGPCPWNSDARLLMVGMKAKNVATDALPPSNLVFLIDVSGSMDEPDKLPLAQRAFRLLTETLTENDRVSIVTYAGEDAVVLDGASGDQRETILRAIDDLFAGGSTAGAAGIETAYAIAQKHFIEGGNNRVILATDGDLNVGVTSEGELTRLIEEKKLSGVYLSVLGFGTGNYKDNKLEAIADNGNGNYAYIDSVTEAKRVLVTERGGTFFTVAKDVKFQIEFNPALVKSYRQIGYENRQMDAEDFEDDTKDGGEIGAGHTVTALYELILQDNPSDAQSALKYQTTTATDSSEYLTVSVRAKAPDSDVSALYAYPVGGEAVVDALDADMAFAACVAQTGMLLSGSEYMHGVTYADIAEQLRAIDGITDDPARDEFAYMVRALRERAS